MESFLTQLKLEGYKIVHVVSNASYQPNPELVARLDFSKQSLQTVAFTGVAPAGDTNLGGNVLTSGRVDVMKNEFVHIESSTQTETRELAASDSKNRN
jgi:hypothetical protein